MNKETTIMREIMLALSEAGHTVWRNNTGMLWAGQKIHADGQTVTLKDARRMPVGLCVGSSDLIGIQTATGRFFAIEVKTSAGRRTAEQQQFIDHVIRSGGIAGIARSPAEALSLLSAS